MRHVLWKTSDFVVIEIDIPKNGLSFFEQQITVSLESESHLTTRRKKKKNLNSFGFRRAGRLVIMLCSFLVQNN